MKGEVYKNEIKNKRRKRYHINNISSNHNGFRPVFCLKSNVKLDSCNGKDGTAEDKAYDLQ